MTHKSQGCPLPFPYKCPDPALDLSFLPVSSTLYLSARLLIREAASSEDPQLPDSKVRGLLLLFLSLCSLDFLKSLSFHDHAGAALTTLV